MKTSELTDRALDWAVAEALGTVHKNEDGQYHSWWPSTDWSQGGPIIEREGIGLWRGYTPTLAWVANKPKGIPFEQHGPTPLVAAMRCYVASKLGDEIEIPEELK